MGIASNEGMFAAFALETNIPAFLRKGASAALGGQLDISGDFSTLRDQWADFSAE